MNAKNDTEILSVTADVKRRNEVCANVRQEVVVVIDASPSFKGEKARHAQVACGELNTELAQPMNKNGFVVSIIHFNSQATVVNPWTQASELEGRIRPLAIDSATNMTAALEMALNELDTHKREAGKQYLRPVVLFFTDGCFNEGGSPVVVAAELKAKADLVTVAFGDDADEDLLRELASSPQHFYRVNNGAELRNFMARAGVTMTISMAQKRDATRSLAMLNAQ